MAQAVVMEKLLAVQQKCPFQLMVTCVYRTLAEQAKLWRQSRKLREITAKIYVLRRSGFGFLADTLESVGPQYGAHVTNACCGESWHNYGRAFDAIPMIDGKQATDTSEAWLIYGKIAEAEGLTWGGRWTGFPDYVHVQMDRSNNPLNLYTVDEAKKLLMQNYERRAK